MKSLKMSEFDAEILSNFNEFIKQCKRTSINIVPHSFLTRKEYINELFYAVLRTAIRYKKRFDEIPGKLGEWVVYVLENIMNFKDFVDIIDEDSYIFDGKAYEIPDYEYIDEKGNIVFYVDYMKKQEVKFDLKKGMEDFVKKEKEKIKGKKKLYEVYGFNIDDFENIYYEYKKEIFNTVTRPSENGMVVRATRYLIFYILFLYGTGRSMFVYLKLFKELNAPISSRKFVLYNRTYIFLIRLLQAKGLLDKKFDHKEGYLGYKKRKN